MPASEPHGPCRALWVGRALRPVVRPEGGDPGDDLTQVGHAAIENNLVGGTETGDDRFGDSRTHRDYTTVEQGAGMNQQPTGERSEVCRTLAESWGYDTREADYVLRTTGELVHLLVNSVAANANLLLNIGPRDDGTIPKAMRERLLDIGAWLKVNGEAIYGTRPWPQPAVGNLRCTVSRLTGATYLTAMSWPGTELVVDAGIPTTSRTQISLLGSDGRPLTWRRQGSHLVITTPAPTPTRATAGEHAYVFRIDNR